MDPDLVGVGDVVIGAPNRSGEGEWQSGKAFLYSGRTGGLLETYRGNRTGGRLGAAVAGVGDLDRDGVPDLAVSEPGGLEGKGSVTALSGKTKMKAWKHRQRRSSEDEFGFFLAPVGDVNRDGVRDVVVGSRGARVTVLSGRSGERVWESPRLAPQTMARFVSGGGDFNGDGIPDVACTAGTLVFLFSRTTGGEIARFNIDDGYHNVAFVGDLNGDGLADLAVGSPGAGVVRVLAGRR